MAVINFRKEDTYRNLYDGILQIKGEAATIQELEKLSPAPGDIYFVGDTPYFFSGGNWATFGGGQPVIVDADKIFIRILDDPNSYFNFDEMKKAAEALKGVPANNIVFSYSNVYSHSTVYSNAIEKEVINEDEFIILVASMGKISFLYTPALYDTLNYIQDYICDIYEEKPLTTVDRTGNIVRFVYEDGDSSSNHLYSASVKTGSNVIYILADEEGHPYTFVTNNTGVITEIRTSENTEVICAKVPIEHINNFIGYQLYIGSDPI